MSMQSITVRLDQKEAQVLFSKLNSAYRLIAPVEKAGKGRFSDTPLFDYDEARSFNDISLEKQTFFSAKSVVFPLRETIFSLYEGKLKMPELQIKPTILFLRACDIHAIQVTDLHFLRDSNLRDVYYARRREKVKFCLIECRQSFENCYCVSMGTNKTDDYSFFMRKTGEGYEFIVHDSMLQDFFPRRNDPVDGPYFVESNDRAISIPENIPGAIFTDEMWEEYSKRCIACGRCNVSCPTCTCFTVQDIAGDSPAAGERRRIWSSCHVDKFSLLAGGHDFRKECADRMRYRTLHKISDFKRRQGRQMCVGCGRCDDVCPEYISMFKCINKINQVMKDGKYVG